MIHLHLSVTGSDHSAYTDPIQTTFQSNSIIYTKEGSTINVPTFEYQPIRPEGDFYTFTYSTYTVLLSFTQRKAKHLILTLIIK